MPSPRCVVPRARFGLQAFGGCSRRLVCGARCEVWCAGCWLPEVAPSALRPVSSRKHIAGISWHLVASDRCPYQASGGGSRCLVCFARCLSSARPRRIAYSSIVCPLWPDRVSTIESLAPTRDTRGLVSHPGAYPTHMRKQLGSLWQGLGTPSLFRLRLSTSRLHV